MLLNTSPDLQQYTAFQFSTWVVKFMPAVLWHQGFTYYAQSYASTSLHAPTDQVRILHSIVIEILPPSLPLSSLAPSLSPPRTSGTCGLRSLPSWRSSPSRRESEGAQQAPQLLSPVPQAHVSPGVGSGGYGCGRGTCRSRLPLSPTSS